MKLLLDTQVFLWSQGFPERLGDSARDALEDERNELYLSAASSWEIAIKHALGKLALPAPPMRYVPERLRSEAIIPLEITHRHALGVTELPPVHRDPFDRMLVAQANLEALTLVTSDPAFAGYDVPTLAAR